MQLNKAKVAIVACPLFDDGYGRMEWNKTHAKSRLGVVQALPIDHARAATVPYVPAELMRASFTPRKRMHANAMPMHASRHDQRASSPYVQ